MMYDHGMNGWGWGLMTVAMVLFWGLLVFGVVLLVRYLGRAQHQHPGARPSDPRAGGPVPRPTPEDMLGERFARGEIDADEYRHRMDALRAGRGAGPG
ncbi:SHOCT domain-containing protein [Kitasatospora paranensis]|uniref:SHOCT domain-containing protein n=1 Tax=Kitasatospora paranensis TaxID=258053 RepID=A0ABW2FP16_9ACTN